jgi:hypothetical protein
MICKGCLKESDGTGYWRTLITPHDSNYILCQKCYSGYKDHSKPIKPINLVDRFNEMKRRMKDD